MLDVGHQCRRVRFPGVDEVAVPIRFPTALAVRGRTLLVEYSESVRREAVAVCDDRDRVGPVELARHNGHPLRHAHVDVVALDWVDYASLS
ncbi:hypothetical protein [Haloarcula sp. JP-L23]|uniref:hypothetical protein n=1 Tax=Haloarcula sp. JP-L23 TaxID=2716717 RepID=UPI00140EDF57|nr:hypothetical protein G9465_24670 [Haloarcula sp. JP-L23]